MRPQNYRLVLIVHLITTILRENFSQAQRGTLLVGKQHLSRETFCFKLVSNFGRRVLGTWREFIKGAQVSARAYMALKLEEEK